MLLGARAIAQGGWLGADNAFGLAALGVFFCLPPVLSFLVGFVIRSLLGVEV